MSGNLVKSTLVFRATEKIVAISVSMFGELLRLLVERSDKREKQGKSRIDDRGMLVGFLGDTLYIAASFVDLLDDDDKAQLGAKVIAQEKLPEKVALQLVYQWIPREVYEKRSLAQKNRTRKE